MGSPRTEGYEKYLQSQPYVNPRNLNPSEYARSRAMHTQGLQRNHITSFPKTDNFAFNEERFPYDQMYDTLISDSNNDNLMEDEFFDFYLSQHGNTRQKYYRPQQYFHNDIQD